MVEPVVVPRAQHTLSRREVDPDALKVLYRLHQNNHLAYLVGGSVRDLLLGRRPKDFDIGTDAHPYQVKRLFRNCWIIGRRFRLAHVKFGTKTIEVATFRRQVGPGTEGEAPLHHAHEAHDDTGGAARPHEGHPAHAARGGQAIDDDRDRLLHRDNTFGTPEEDAFRRDFTVNALFYDIAHFAIIDYVGGLEDLRRGLIRCIGDPDERFREDPVRMLRAVVLAARLGFTIDPPIREAIARQRQEIGRAAPARLLEEFYKILRSGSAAPAFRGLAETGLLRHIAPEIDTPLSPRFVRALEALDRYRGRFETPPDALTNAVLVGTILVPLGLLRPRRRRGEEEPPRPVPSPLGLLPVARRDIERLGQVVALQRRLLDVEAPPRARTGIMMKHAFADALTWLDIHGDAPEVLAHWQALVASHSPVPERPPSDQDAEDGALPPRRRRRRRRRRPFPPRG
jgi:poly(A) polymerase